jgi:uncharacterized protein (DUF427 family)
LKTDNVWTYPRPPSLERVDERLVVVFGGSVIADTLMGYRVLETSHAPTYYIPPNDVLKNSLVPNARLTICEWKGQARYFDVVSGEQSAAAAAWTYDKPVAAFHSITSYVAFYAEPMDACYVGNEQVKPQPGNFYGGWVTSNLVGPIKGAAGTMNW